MNWLGKARTARASVNKVSFGMKDENSSAIFDTHDGKIVTTAQIVTPQISFRFQGKKIIIKQAPGVCGWNYYTEYGIGILPQALHRLRSQGNKLRQVLEAGLGKGVYLCVLGKQPSVKLLFGVDIDRKAVRLTKENLKTNGVQKRAIFRTEPIERTYRRKWQMDLIVFDLPLIPLPSIRFLPEPVWTFLGGAGPTGRRFIDFMIENSNQHLHRGGGLFFVQSSFIKGGFELTKQLLAKHGFEPKLIGQRKKYLNETILTHGLQPSIERSTGQKFSHDKHGDYFFLQAVLGIKK